MSKTPSLWKTFLVFLAPLMLSNALQSLFGTVSNALLGQMIGLDALAAVSVFFPVMFFLFAFVMGLSTGERRERRSKGPRPTATHSAKIVTLRTNKICQTGSATTSHLTEASCSVNRK